MGDRSNQQVLEGRNQRAGSCNVLDQLSVRLEVLESERGYILKMQNATYRSY
jgi:hypothetical protein